MNWPDDFINKIICGDCLEVMKEMPAESIDMMITSPPYWGLRDYGIEQIFGGDLDCKHEWGDKLPHPKQEKRTIKQLRSSSGLSWNRGESASIFKWQEYSPKNQGNFCLKCQAWKGQLGLEPTPEFYIEHLTEIFNEVKRVLKKEGTLWLNIGDTYSANRTYQVKQTKCPDESSMGMIAPDNVQPKCLCMIPERLAWSLIQNGWILRNKIIWYKPNAMPSSVKDRFSNRWEYIFLFSKSQRYYFDLDSVREPHQTHPHGEKALQGGVSQKGTRHRSAPKESMRFASGMRTEHPLGKNPGDVMEMNEEEYRKWYFEERKKKSWHDHKDDLGKGFGQQTRGFKKEQLPHPLGRNPGDIFEIGAETRPKAKLGNPSRIPGGGARCQKDPRWTPPEGKRPIDFWPINTQPFPEAHFAVFPEKLCEKPIKAGCPEEVCKKCGKARERVMEKLLDPAWEPKYESRYKDSHGSGKMGNPRSRHRNTAIEQALHTTTKTIGWTSCDCNAGFEGGIVLDPFAGAGTALYVAKQLRRRFIGIDIKQEYCELAEKRLAQGVL